MGAVNLYGDDDNSIYLELSYSQKNITIFTGGTPEKGAYGSGAGIINIGATATKELKLSSTYTLPMAVSLITNPREEKIFMVLSLSF